MKNTKQKGFTLIELLIVIGIIAILAAAVIIAINPGRQFQQARNASRWSHVNSVANAVYSYVIHYGGAFPGCLYDEGVEIGFDEDTEMIDIDACENYLVDDFMASLPEDPSAGETYKIGFDGTRIKITSSAEEAEDIEIIQ